MTSPWIKKALALAKEAHKGQKDKAGKPYIQHPLYVASQLEDEDGKIVALLHDAIEDGEMDIHRLADEGFSFNIIKAVDLLTRKGKEPYREYIHRIGIDDLATRVKVEDLKHNMDLSRIPNPTEADKARAKKYKVALEYLLFVRNGWK